MVDNIAATTYSNFIFGITFPICNRMLLLLLYVDNRLAWSLRRIFIACDAASSLVAIFISTISYFHSRHTEFAVSITAPKHSSVLSSDIISIRFVTILSSSIFSGDTKLMMSPFLKIISRFLKFHRIVFSISPSLKLVLFSLHRPLRM